MAECGLCSMLKAACSRLTEGENGRKMCEEMVDRLSKKEIDVEGFFKEMKEKTGMDEEKILSELRKEIDVTKDEEK